MPLAARLPAAQPSPVSDGFPAFLLSLSQKLCCSTAASRARSQLVGVASLHRCLVPVLCLARHRLGGVARLEMGRPQEVPLDEAPDVQAAPIDEDETELPSGIGKDAASSAPVDSLPALSVGNGGSKAHSSAESMDAPAENGDHSSAPEDKESSAAEAGVRCEKAEVGSRRRYPESGANSCERIGCAHHARAQASEISWLI